MDDHGSHQEMKHDALSVAAAALEANPEEKDISKHIKVGGYLWRLLFIGTVINIQFILLDVF